MVSPPSTPRRALGQLNINTPSMSMRAAAGLKAAKAATALSRTREGEMVGKTTTVLEPSATPGKTEVHESDKPGSRKRSRDSLTASKSVSQEAIASKKPEERSDRPEPAIPAAKDVDKARPSDQDEGGPDGSTNAADAHTPSLPVASAQSERQEPSRPSSCSTTPVNSAPASQDTSFTDLEDSPATGAASTSLGGRRRRFTRDEERQHALALRSRLQVAMYKLRTNQTDLPLSKVQIRPTNSKPRSPLPTSAPNPKFPFTTGASSESARPRSAGSAQPPAAKKLKPYSYQNRRASSFSLFRPGEGYGYRTPLPRLSNTPRSVAENAGYNRRGNGNARTSLNANTERSGLFRGTTAVSAARASSARGREVYEVGYQAEDAVRVLARAAAEADANATANASKETTAAPATAVVRTQQNGGSGENADGRDKVGNADVPATPKLPRYRDGETGKEKERNLESPNRDSSPANKPPRAVDEVDLTSSVVRGRAASGLLKLSGEERS